MRNNIPNWLTAFRIVLIPVFIVIYYMPQAAANDIATAVFVLAAITDWLDGFLARKLDQHSAFGAFLDPVADKLMVGTALVLLVSDERVLSAVFDRRSFAIVVAIIVGREIAVSALREWMAELGARARVAVSWVGKFKTISQMVAVSMLIYREPLHGLPILHLGELLLYAAAVLTLYSMFIYLRAAWPKLKDPRS